MQACITKDKHNIQQVRAWANLATLVVVVVTAAAAGGGATREASDWAGAGRAGSTTISIFMGRSVIDGRARDSEH